MSKTGTLDAIAHNDSANIICRPLPPAPAYPYIPAGSPLMKALQRRINGAWRAILAGAPT